jgi:hypothetical protein
MAHWAELDDNNIVLQVTVGDNDDPNGDQGYQWLLDNLGGRWVKTSYNNNIRKQYAGIGYSYDEINDVFISPSPFPSWILDEELNWKAPVPIPEEGFWSWDEESLSWVEQTLEKPSSTWTIHDKTFTPSIPYPDDDKIYFWNEGNQSWDEIEDETPSN